MRKGSEGLVSSVRKRRIAFDEGLFKQVRTAGDESWIWRFRFNGHQREMGLGPTLQISLAQAREQKEIWGQHLREGRDPIAERARERGIARATQAHKSSMTYDADRTFSSRSPFRHAAERYIESRLKTWTTDDSPNHWRSTLATYAYPVIGAMSWSEIRTAHVVAVLEPIWNRITETATRLRGRIEAIINACIVWADLDNHANPARWRGHLSLLFDCNRAVEHYPALPWQEMPNFIRCLRKTPGISAPALEFQILTAARSGMVRQARWKEIDFEQRLWNVPADHMKGKQAFTQPLSSSAVAVLERRWDHGKDLGNFIFPSPKGGGILSDTALRELMIDLCAAGRDVGSSKWRAKDQNGNELIPVPHGCRSSFRDWAGDNTSWAAEVAEAALAHLPRSKVERAYRRGTALNFRATMLEEWCSFCDAGAIAPSPFGIR